MVSGRQKRGENVRRIPDGVWTIVLSMFAIWWAILAFTVMFPVDDSWWLVRWSPVALIPWAIVDIVREYRR
jgi:hypothetical protein